MVELRLLEIEGAYWKLFFSLGFTRVERCGDVLSRQLHALGLLSVLPQHWAKVADIVARRARIEALLIARFQLQVHMHRSQRAGWLWLHCHQAGDSLLALGIYARPDLPLQVQSTLVTLGGGGKIAAILSSASVCQLSP